MWTTYINASCFRGLVQDSACNLTFKLLFIVVFFQMVHNKRLFRRSSVKYWTFSKGPTWSDLFPLRIKKKWKAAVNCPKIVVYTVKIIKCLVRIISEHPQKAISLMFETETVGLCLVRKLNLVGGGMAPQPPLPSSGYASVKSLHK